MKRLVEAESMTNAPSREEILKVALPIETINWRKHNLTVIKDGYLRNGVRVHVVKEKLDDQPIIVDSAYVISEIV
ncbi:hypothetical protein [Pseudoalteromonas luteoviolacea]|uniref:Uncharacterized protein n=1 Tax=Pseudoalteromonas luteoviolacea S4060-1 TaxID=1365257 RepID=A0A167KVH9_9GAMM|nr:hypothetical protein [Pseudoalteromonas luteoviolacea]KZN63348.1 hypothetical protein N478_03600 [Pseudoalteromonas luteoviolacea S4060-1]